MRRPRPDALVQAAGIERQSSAHSRAERLIAGARVGLAAAAFLGFALSTSAAFGEHRRAIFITGVYLCYALVLAAIVWFAGSPLPRLPLATHAVDLSTFPIVMFYTERAASPLFVLFVFSLACALLRWDWRGVVWTGVTVMIAYIGLSLIAGAGEPEGELSSVRVVIRTAHLGVTTFLLAYVAAHQERLTGELAGIAALPRALPGTIDDLLVEVAFQTQRVMGADTVVVAWQEHTGAAVLAVSTRAPGRHAFAGPLRDLLAPGLHRSGFLCRNLRARRPRALYTAGTTLHHWAGNVLAQPLLDLLPHDAVVSAPVETRLAHVRIFAAWDGRPTLDDLVIAGSLARLAAARLDQFHLVERLRNADVAEERLRLARDLHDGVLQTLAAAGLELESAIRLVDERPADAIGRLREAQAILAAEQRELRTFIEELRPGASRGDGADAMERLAALESRLERQSNVRVELENGRVLSGLPADLREQLVRLIHEALVNVGKHAAARNVRVHVGQADGRVMVTITDDGRGFPFHGRFELDDLDALGVGPLTLKERVASLEGTLVLESSAAGSRVEMTVPAVPGRASS